jgi:hypothetical protein
MSGPETEKEHRVSEEKELPQSSDYGVPQNAKIMEVLNADYALALSTGPQLSPTSRRSLQLYAVLLVAFMGSLSNGFDGSGK